jgi:hypothetical protein
MITFAIICALLGPAFALFIGYLQISEARNRKPASPLANNPEMLARLHHVMDMADGKTAPKRWNELSEDERWNKTAKECTKLGW